LCCFSDVGALGSRYENIIARRQDDEIQERHGHAAAWTGRLGLGVAAALLTLWGLATAVSAQEAHPSVRVTHIGWAADRTLSADESRDLGRAFGVVGSSPLRTNWDCGDFRCHYVRVDFSGIEPKPDLEKADGAVDGPGWILTVTRWHPAGRTITGLTKHIGVDEAGGGNGPDTYYAAVPCNDERVRVSIEGVTGRTTNTSVIIPAHVPAAFHARTPLAASTLVHWEENTSSLPMLVTVFPKVAGATHYELQYIFRGDLHQGSGNYSQVVTTRAVTASQKRGLYERLGADWSRHAQRETLSALTNDDFDGEDAGWIFVTTPLPKLVRGAEGWPHREIDEDDITAALAAGRGKARIGVRVQPILDCSLADSFAPDLTEFCSAGTYALDTLSLRGKKSQVSYKTVRLSDLE